MGTQCPGRNENCMNAENYAQRRRMVDTKCPNILQMESCPYQFSCSDARICCAAIATCSNEKTASNVPCEATEDADSCTTVHMCCDVAWCRSNSTTLPQPTSQVSRGGLCVLSLIMPLALLAISRP